MSEKSLPAIIAVRKPGDGVQVASPLPSRSVEQARLVYLSRRLAPHIAAAVAPLIYGYGDARS